MIAPSVWDVLVVIPVLFYFLPGKNQRVTAVLGTAIGTVYLIAGGFMVWVGCATYGKQWLQVGLPLVAILIPFCLLAIVGSMRGLRLGAANLSALIMAVVGTLGISTWSGIVLGL